MTASPIADSPLTKRGIYVLDNQNNLLKDTKRLCKAERNLLSRVVIFFWVCHDKQPLSGYALGFSHT